MAKYKTLQASNEDKALNCLKDNSYVMILLEQQLLNHLNHDRCLDAVDEIQSSLIRFEHNIGQVLAPLTYLCRDLYKKRK